MIRIFLFLFLTPILLHSCGKEASQQQGIVETPANGEVSVADIIRNPITANSPLDSSKVAKMTFEEKTFDFGTVEEGEKVTHIFKFTNTGTVPLLIGSARSTCGCTVPKWPREPIGPGESGQIDIRFDTTGKPNKQTKPVTINANTLPAETKLYITGQVNPKK